MIPAPPTDPAGPALRDIHLPPPPSWWPPAPGWWLLAVLVLLLAVAGCVLVRRWRQRRRQRARILAELDALAARHARDGDAAQLAAGLHQLLRRVARRWDPAAAQARGAAWHRTLAQVPVDPATLAQLEALDEAIYRPQRYDTQAALAATARWVSAALARRRQEAGHA
ncbi:DUF4381 family protein [Fulvimonas yonginensis]|uniref:DUF4381 family protein n=1 Tax=Fulvimonas yonginensis TaxID=1495200 RepID=A0ABU8J8S2_9GAMM